MNKTIYQSKLFIIQLKNFKEGRVLYYKAPHPLDISHLNTKCNYDVWSFLSQVSGDSLHLLQLLHQVRNE